MLKELFYISVKQKIPVSNHKSYGMVIINLGLYK